MLNKTNILSRISLAVVVFLTLLTVGQKGYAQFNENIQRVHWIPMVSEYVTWPSEDTITTMHIGVFGRKAPEYPILDSIVDKGNFQVKHRPVVVHRFERVSDIKPTQIILVTESAGDMIRDVYDKISGHGTLVITNNLRTDLQQYSMINFVKNGNSRQPFRSRPDVASKEGLSISDRVVIMSGSDEALSQLDENINKELQEKENSLLLIEKDLEARRRLINSKLVENEQKREELDEQKSILVLKNLDIQEKTELANHMKYSADSLQRVYDRQTIVQDRLRLKLADSKAAIESSEKELADKNRIYKESQANLELRKAELQELMKTVGKQEQVKLGGYIFIAVILVLVIIITISNISRQKKNRQLEAMNDEVDRQKDHIEAQSHQLMQINKELEKLSIVASQTDNGVVIMDNLGNIEWVNRGFTNMYGYTANDLKTQSVDCLTGFYQNNEDIANIKDDCLQSSESRVFECEIKTKQGKSVWIQSTLTPILDDNNEIGRLVTIDTDITQIKEQELAIMSQGKTLALQRDELASQNEFIKEQNAHISTSLTYAKTIQDTVMPLEVNVTKYFKYFGIFIPLQIVSGDFYWFARIPGDEKLAFTAAVDCTGHGVPGAFMCMITTRLLSEIIVEHRVYDTRDILTQLNKGLVAALKQEQTDNNDSLEICLCKFNHIDEENYELTFSGAKRPLYIYHDETQQFDVLKGDRKTIGGLLAKRNTLEFTSESMILKKNDKVYMTTDGFVNQFDTNCKKYGSDKFLKLLKSIASMNLADQKIVLEQEYANYRGGAEQNDDVTVFAVQLI